MGLEEEIKDAQSCHDQLDQNIKFVKEELERRGILPEDDLFKSVLMIQDLYSKLVSKNGTLYDIAQKDGLTGIYNWRHFNEALERELKRATRSKDKLSIAMMDIDGFKEYNDTYGHPQGDIALKHVSQTLQKNIRDADILARYGGEELAIILTGTDLRNAAIKANRLRELVEQLTIPAGEKVTQPGYDKVTLSIGINDYQTDDTVESLVKKADLALYKANNTGKNKVCIYTPTNILDYNQFIV